MKKPVKLYKIIEKVRKYFEIKSVDKEVRLIKEQALNKLGQIKLVLSNKIETIEEKMKVKEEIVVKYKSYEGIEYSREHMAVYIFISLCFYPEYWVDSYLEIKNNKVTGWIDEEKIFEKE